MCNHSSKSIWKALFFSNICGRIKRCRFPQIMPGHTLPQYTTRGYRTCFVSLVGGLGDSPRGSQQITPLACLVGLSNLDYSVMISFTLSPCITFPLPTNLPTDLLFFLFLMNLPSFLLYYLPAYFPICQPVCLSFQLSTYPFSFFSFIPSPVSNLPLPPCLAQPPLPTTPHFLSQADYFLSFSFFLPPVFSLLVHPT